jgi:hypothetical protein
MEYKSLIRSYIWNYTMMVKYINEIFFTKSLTLHLATKNLQQHCIFRLLICRFVFFPIKLLFIEMQRIIVSQFLFTFACWEGRCFLYLTQ